jgi:hypothetical protein
MRKTIIALALALTVASGSVVAAQADVPTNPNILQAIQQLQVNDAQEVAVLQGLQSTLTGVQSTLTSIQTALQGLTPPAASNVRTTGAVLGFSGDAIRCAAINLSTSPKAVIVSLIGPAGQVQNVTVTLQPLASTIQNLFITAGEDVYACRFTVQDGTRADITASLTYIRADTIAAVVPAE